MPLLLEQKRRTKPEGEMLQAGSSGSRGQSEVSPEEEESRKQLENCVSYESCMTQWLKSLLLLCHTREGRYRRGRN